MTHSIPNVSQITMKPACSLGTAEVAYGRGELLIHEQEEPRQSKGDHTGKRSEQRLSDWNHDVAASRSGGRVGGLCAATFHFWDHSHLHAFYLLSQHTFTYTIHSVMYPVILNPHRAFSPVSRAVVITGWDLRAIVARDRV